MKKQLLLSVLLCLCFSFFLGCGDDDDDDSSAAVPDDDDDDVDDDSQDDDDNDADDDVADDDDDDDSFPKACDSIFDQDLFPTYEIQITQEHWDGIKYLWDNWETLLDAGEDLKQYFPLAEFRGEEEIVPDALIRLKGSPNKWIKPKMQFVIAFNEVNPDGRWRGLRKLNLDSPSDDPSFLRERLAFSIMQEMNVMSSCANHSKLYVNGEFYGVHTNIEKVDKELIQRYFGKEDDEGSLYKFSDYRRELLEGDYSDLEELLAADTLETIDALVDLDQAVMEWAVEAVLPHLDGFFVGAGNFYLYRHPIRGWVYIPYDIDYAFEAGSVELDLITFKVSWGEKATIFNTLLADPTWREQYLENIEAVKDSFTGEFLEQRIDTWAAQINPSLQQEPASTFTYQEHLEGVEELREFVEDRFAYIDDWLECEAFSGNVEVYSYNGNDYHFWERSCLWLQSLAYCENLGGTLAVALDEPEHDFLVTQAQALGDDNWWTGANDLVTDAVWTDADGSLLDYLPWGVGQPNGSESNQHCVLMDFGLSGDWNDKYCDKPNPAICKVPSPSK